MDAISTMTGHLLYQMNVYSMSYINNAILVILCLFFCLENHKASCDPCPGIKFGSESFVRQSKLALLDMPGFVRLCFYFLHADTQKKYITREETLIRNVFTKRKIIDCIKYLGL